MFRNIIKTTFRFFTKHQGYSLMNIIGLSLGLGACIAIFLFVQDEMSYDKFHKDYKRIVRAEGVFDFQGEVSHWAASQGFFGPRIAEKFPEVESFTRMLHFSSTETFSYEDIRYVEEKVFYVDSSFFEVFQYNLMHGDINTALEKPNNIVITQSTSKRYFGDKNPVGKILKTERESFIISGLMEDVPDNSHLHFDMIIPISTVRKRWKNVDRANQNAFYTYLKINQNVDLDTFAEKLDKGAWDVYGYIQNGDTLDIPEGLNVGINVTPIADIHLKSNLEKEFEKNSDIKTIYIFSTIAFLILILACINYINLATARSVNRSKEVAVRKILGGTRKNIFIQFMSESFILALISTVIALSLVELALPYINQITDKSLDLYFPDNMILLLIIFCCFIFVSVIAGFYPASILSRFEPIRILNFLKGFKRRKKLSLNFRRVLVILQIFISVCLISLSIIIYLQLKYIQNKNLGFQKENVLVIPFPMTIDKQKISVLKNELLKNIEVESASSTSGIPGERMPVLTVRMDELAKRNPDNGQGVFGIRVLSADQDIIETFGYEIADGRAFSKEYKTDEREAFILNEAAVKELEIEDPVGKDFEYLYGMAQPKKGKIIGVVKDFHYASLHSEVDPLMIHIFQPYAAYLSLRVNSENINELVEEIEKEWENAFPNVPFDFFFLDTYYDKLYTAEMNTARIVGFLTILAIIIACLGLFGLISYLAEQKTKEIGIRKVLGASTGNIIKLLLSEFVVLTLIALALAIFPTYLIANRWLEDFAFRINISIWIFLASAAFALFITIGTVIFKSYRAALYDPARTLRYE
jgi:putative ABC transport system permease protein